MSDTPKMDNPDEVEHERQAQAALVMPLIGPLLDAWDQLSNDAKDYAREDSPTLETYLEKISRIMEAIE